MIGKEDVRDFTAHVGVKRKLAAHVRRNWPRWDAELAAMGVSAKWRRPPRRDVDSEMFKLCLAEGREDLYAEIRETHQKQFGMSLSDWLRYRCESLEMAEDAIRGGSMWVWVAYPEDGLLRGQASRTVRRNWTRHAIARNHMGVKCDPVSTEAVTWCVTGSLDQGVR